MSKRPLKIQSFPYFIRSRIGLIGCNVSEQFDRAVSEYKVVTVSIFNVQPKSAIHNE